jgi:hypothetical protein
MASLHRCIAASYIAGIAASHRCIVYRCIGIAESLHRHRWSYIGISRIVASYIVDRGIVARCIAASLHRHRCITRIAARIAAAVHRCTLHRHRHRRHRHRIAASWHRRIASLNRCIAIPPSASADAAFASCKPSYIGIRIGCIAGIASIAGISASHRCIMYRQCISIADRCIAHRHRRHSHIAASLHRASWHRCIAASASASLHRIVARIADVHRGIVWSGIARSLVAASLHRCIVHRYRCIAGIAAYRISQHRCIAGIAHRCASLASLHREVTQSP